MLPDPPFVGRVGSEREAADWALTWLPDGGEPVAESYVNLIPDRAGRYSRQRLARRIDRCDARILRVP
jgi:hypothetical protein